ncbi:MAG: ArsR family transcriptional regulator [Paracoccaceae bacterium]
MPLTDTTVADVFAGIAAAFGLSRPAGQCFSAIWRAAQAPCADELVAGLGLARSNVSTALKELRGWNLIGVARVPGDRKEYFTAPADPWEVLRRIALARQRLVVAPLLDRLIALEAATGDVRLAALHSAMAQIAQTGEAMAALDGAGFAKRLAALADGGEPKKKKKKH